MNADESGVERLKAGGDAQSPAWSPDGKEIAYAAAHEGFFEIHVLTLKTGKVRRLTEGMHAISPAWSPDGKQIAFIAYAHGSPEVYVMNDKGKNLQRLTRAGYPSRQCRFLLISCHILEHPMVLFGSPMCRQFKHCVSSRYRARTTMAILGCIRR
ncbi:Tol-Pal system protein TolB [Anaerolineae bacterium]|nr:Tol-Pal system protein TolB [Anaerolineae bacterium]